jgi:hypothetical protein
LALSCPAIDDEVEPVTRFRIAADDPGWTNVTELGWPIEKLFQFTIARDDDWFIVSPLLTGEPTLTDPLATVGP